MTDAQSWFYIVDGQQQGPISEDVLRGALTGGTVAPDCLVWTQGMTGWVPASTIPAFTHPASVGPPVGPQASGVIAKRRHGCLTAWLVVALAMNSILTLVYVAWSLSPPTDNLLLRAAWVSPVLALGCVANVVFTVALFRWKRWGFYGAAASAAVVFAINLAIGVSPASALLGLAGVAVLYGVLLIGGERAAWPQLD